MKATEYRTFLLYSGPVCLLDVLPAEMYNNFILLFVAVTLLLSPSLCAEYADYSHDLLVLFVNHFGDLYGRDKITYNVHGLVHLRDDAKLYGVLDNVSAFPFENYMGKIKRMIRKPKSPLQQLVRRLSEVNESQLGDDSSQPELEDIVCPKQIHCEGPIVDGIAIRQQYKQVKLQKFIVKLSDGDRYVQLKNSDVVAVQNIITDMDMNVWLVYRKFHDVSCFFDYPLPSADIEIYKHSHLGSSLHYCHSSDVQRKYVVLPHKTWHIGIHLLHSDD